MGLVESKPGLDKSSADFSQRKLTKPHPIIVNGNKLTTNVPGHPDDDFAVVDPTTNNPINQSARDRELTYALQDRKDVPPNLAKGLNANRRISRKKRKERALKNKPPIYAPHEDPPEID